MKNSWHLHAQPNNILDLQQSNSVVEGEKLPKIPMEHSNLDMLKMQTPMERSKNFVLDAMQMEHPKFWIYVPYGKVECLKNYQI